MAAYTRTGISGRDPGSRAHGARPLSEAAPSLCLKGIATTGLTGRTTLGAYRGRQKDAHMHDDTLDPYAGTHGGSGTRHGRTTRATPRAAPASASRTTRRTRSPGVCPGRGRRAS